MDVDTEGKVLIDLDPQPTIWPVCIAPNKRNDPTPCETPFVRRIGISWTTGRRIWTWARDCKHKGPLSEETVRMEYQEPDEGVHDLRTLLSTLVETVEQLEGIRSTTEFEDALTKAKEALA